MNAYELDRRGFLRAGGAAVVAASAIANEGGGAMVRVAMLSKWHAHAKGYAESLRKMPDVKLTLVWDEEPERGAAWAKELGVEFDPNLDAIWKRGDVDAVACCAPTNRHAEIMTAAADAGKHVFTEKVMALTIDECNRVRDAVKKNNVKFCISYPFRTRPEVLYAKQAVDDGLLGQLTFIRARVAHNAGSAGWLPPHFWDPVGCGGGSMMDLGAHPMYLCRWIGGQPKRIASTFNYMTGHEVEDNSVSVIEFENKAIGVCETRFMSTYSPFSLELSGTEGSIFVGGPEEKSVRIRSNNVQGGKSWITPGKLPDALPSTTQMWVDGILRGAAIPFDTEQGTQLTELMQYAYQAHREGKHVDIPKR